MSRFLLGVGLSVVFLGSVLFVTSFASPHWFSAEIKNETSTMGLWKQCGAFPGIKEDDDCKDLDEVTLEWITDPQALQCTALLMVAVAFSSAIRLFCIETPFLYRLCGAAACAAGVFGIAGAGKFHSDMMDDEAYKAAYPDLTTEWCVYLNIVANIIMFIAGPPYLVASFRMDTGYDYSRV